MHPLRLISCLAALAILAACAMAPPLPMGGSPQSSAQLLLDSGDQLRIVVLDQADLTGTFIVDESGRIALPLVGQIQARGRTAESLEGVIAAALRQNYLRNPDVTVSVETYRPVFVLGEVASPGQYAYVANLTVQQAVAIAGGFTPRARQAFVDVVRRVDGRPVPMRLELLDLIVPGDTITIGQRLL
jgi:polysaccharide export outer membrane protein